MKKLFNCLLGVLLAAGGLWALDAPGPKREFRSVWLSTVENIDWPSSRYDSDTKKQQDLKNYLIEMKEAGCNAVLFQVRCACDAMYDSPYEPWSYWFSGTQGNGPATDWDPLTYAVEEAHKLGMELHAWVNPYRAVKTPSKFNQSSYISDEHVSKQHPEWILQFSDVYILDPGQQEVRNYITAVLMDIVNRYDIDGLHMDDYFYPYSGISNEDNATFAAENRGFTNRADWRRDNIDLLVKTMMDSINAVKPWVKWGISPFGIYKPGVPSGVTSMDAYNILYCDPIAWLQDGSVDYLTPQCYWSFGYNQDYGLLIPWWASQCKKYGKHFYPGQALYRANEFPANEIPRQVRLNRATDNCDGNVFFTAHSFRNNYKGSADSLKYDLYRYPAIWPVMPWKDDTAPEMPAVCTAQVSADEVVLNWDAPVYADSGDSACGYVIYRAPFPLEDVSDVTTILDVKLSTATSYTDVSSDRAFYAVTTLDRYKNESAPALPPMPFVTPEFPDYATEWAPRTCDFSWYGYSGSTSYDLQVSTDSEFSYLIADETVNDTVCPVVLEYETNYFWRVKADGAAYWSPVWTFRSELPPQVAQLYPKASQGGIATDVTLTWAAFEDATNYELKIYSEDDDPDVPMISTQLSGTSYDLSALDHGTRYYWQIRSDKYDRWSERISFRTSDEYMSTLWSRSEMDDSAPDFGTDTVVTKGLAYAATAGGEYVYISQNISGSLSVRKVNATDGSDDRSTAVSTAGLTDMGDLEASDDGYLFASVPAAAGETFRIYMWQDETQAPVPVYELENTAYDLGEHITVTGSVADGSVMCYAAGGDSDKLLKMTWDVVNEEFTAQQITLGRENNPRPCVALFPGSEDLFVNSQDYYLRHFEADGDNVDWMLRNYTLPQSMHSIAAFQWNDKPYIAGYGSDRESVIVVDIFDGVRTALFAAETPDLGTVPNPEAFGDVEVKDNGDGTFTLFVLGSGNGFAAYIYDAANACTTVSEPLALEQDFILKGNYPNPFNPETKISYDLYRDADVSLKIFDLQGRLMQEMKNRRQAAGSYTFAVNGALWPSGTYIYRITVNERSRAGKMLLIK